MSQQHSDRAEHLRKFDRDHLEPAVTALLAQARESGISTKELGMQMIAHAMPCIRASVPSNEAMLAVFMSLAGAYYRGLMIPEVASRAEIEADVIRNQIADGLDQLLAIHADNSPGAYLALMQVLSGRLGSVKDNIAAQKLGMNPGV